VFTSGEGWTEDIYGERSMNTRTLVAVAVTLVFWSSAFAGIRAGLEGGYTPGHLVLLRFLSASLVFIIYAFFRRVHLPKGKDWIRLALLGFAGITIYHTSLTFGEQSVPAGTASLIIAAAPAFTSIIAMFALRERLTPVGWFGTLLGFVGVGVIAIGSGGAPGFTKGALLILLSAVMTALFFVYQKPLHGKYSAIDLTAYFTWFGTLPMLVFLPGMWHDVAHATLGATLSGIYIGVFPAAVAYVAWAIALAGAPAGVVSSTLYINPVLAIGIAWVWLGELPHIVSIFGGIIAVIGVTIVNLWGTKGRRKRAKSVRSTMLAETADGPVADPLRVD
jgi:drug/metabolite transporter (DMT)-like permease